ncbi:transketolase [Alphaproteobacteria bacterium]|nr:transketolase [Alphaproteobacteria bacterium]
MNTKSKLNLVRARDLNNRKLEKISSEIRKKIVSYSNYAGIPHLGSCLSLVDILVSLYFDVCNINGSEPRDENRDRIVLSKGHGAPALFQILAAKGFYPEAWLFRPNHGGGLFGEHPPTPAHLPGIEAATGSLGHGLPMALGMALSGKIKGLDFHNFVICGDGECNEGSIWESLLFASANCLSNLTVIVDYNGWQATGRSDDILDISPLDKKFESFGFQTTVIDGHNIAILREVLQKAKNSSSPTAVIAKTIKGKGVSFMEDDNNWHYRTPNAEELVLALEELDIS